MATVIVRMWTKEGYHKDIVSMDEQQVRVSCLDYPSNGVGTRHLILPLDAIRVCIDPKDFPEAVEFEVIVRR